MPTPETRYKGYPFLVCIPQGFSPQCHIVTVLSVTALLEMFRPSEGGCLCYIDSLPWGMLQSRLSRNGGLSWNSCSASPVISVPASQVFFASKSLLFSSFSGSFYWHHVGLVRTHSVISPVSGTHKALFIFFSFLSKRKTLELLLIFSVFFIYIYALSIWNFPLQLEKG